MLAALWRVGLFGGIWWSWTGSDLPSWMVGAPVVAAATVLSLKIRRPMPWRFSPVGALLLFPFFVFKSIVGGCDVAVRVLNPRLPIRPAFFRYPIQLEEGSARWFFIHLVSLMPGTLSARVEGDTLIMHALNTNSEVGKELWMAERRVAHGLGIALELGRDEVPSLVPYDAEEAWS